MSGPAAFDIGRSLFEPHVTSRKDGDERPEDGREASHRLRYGRIVDPDSGEVADEVLFAYMAAPATYTREDVVEIHCHGGPAAQRAVLALLLRHGARAAEPGEFTRRAFLNGRIDLTQAESVASLVRARSDVARKAAVRQLEGGLGDRLRALRAGLVSLLAEFEAQIDFSDEDLDELDAGEVGTGLRQVLGGLEALLATAFAGRALEEGVRTAIVGRPNVGKSSLLNALLMRERAIVSDIPGTTRDTIEESTDIGGVPLRLIDTAGLREGRDEIELQGIERSRRAAADADLVLAVLDATAGLADADLALLHDLPREKTLVVVNKSDLADPDPVLTLMSVDWRDGGPRPLGVSAVSGIGLDELREEVTAFVLGEGGVSLEEPLLATERQRRLVEEAVRHGRAAQHAIDAGRSEELVADDLRRAIEAVGAVTGEEVVPDLLDQIFSRFCIGK